MIRINLMSSTATASLSSVGGVDGVVLLSPEEARKEALKRIMILMMFPVALYFYEQQNLPELSQRLAAINIDINALSTENAQNQETVEQIKRIQESQSKVETRLSLVSKINLEKMKEIKIMDLFQNAIPETVWFKELEYERGTFVIKGYALSDSDVSTFLDTLSKSVHFASVNLVGSSEEKISDTYLKFFEIKCLTELPKEGAKNE